MKARCTSGRKWARACGWLVAALFSAAAAQAQVMLPTEQPPCFFVTFNNVTVIPRDAKTAVIQFDVTWGGSWRHDVNHDAVWAFFKFRAEGDPLKGWRHVRLAADPPSQGSSGVAGKVLNPTGYGQAPVGGTKFDFLAPHGDDPSTERGAGGAMGVFVRRADHGMGPASGSKLTVLWDLESFPDVKSDTKVQVKTYGLVMLYVADGSYSLGSGGSESCAFYESQPPKKQAAEIKRIVNATSTMIIKEQINTGPEFPPYRVTGTNAIPTGTKAGQLWARGAEPPEGGEIPATFPNGCKAFYMAAYPLTPMLYAGFLNSVTPEWADERFQPEGFPCHGGITRWREGEGAAYSYRGFVGRKSKALWWMCWPDAASFADWAGLRPMTELEYEKSLRGPRPPIPDECGSSFWGGSFGGGRYNAHPRELVVTVAGTNGLAYHGTHGSGTGTNWPADWPKKDAQGTGVRGGQESASGPPELHGAMWATSCRLDAAAADPERYVTYGFRPARTAPEEAQWNTVKNAQESSPLLTGLK